MEFCLRPQFTEGHAAFPHSIGNIFVSDQLGWRPLGIRGRLMTCAAMLAALAVAAQ
jgi:hypothetical protein